MLRTRMTQAELDAIAAPWRKPKPVKQEHPDQYDIVEQDNPLPRETHFREAPSARNRVRKPSSDLTIANKVEKARRMLSECRSDFDRIQVRDHARAAQEAAKILGIKGIQVEASIIVQDAERAIHKANPAKQTGRKRKGENALPRETHLSDGAIRLIRMAHGGIDDDAYSEIKRQAIKAGEPLSRAMLRKKRTGGNGDIEKPPEGKRIRGRMVGLLETMRLSKNATNYKKAIEFLERAMDAVPVGG